MKEDIWIATENWIKAIEQYYECSQCRDHPSHSSPSRPCGKRANLDQVFARGYFAGWSERQVLKLAKGLKESEEKYPRWE